MLGEFLQNESKQLSESLTLQASKYMQSVWRVAGEPKEDLNDVIEKNKLDYELMQRWIKFVSRPPRYYPYLKDWQAMMAKGGTATEAKKLADGFQSLLQDVCESIETPSCALADGIFVRLSAGHSSTSPIPSKRSDRSP